MKSFCSPVAEVPDLDTSNTVSYESQMVSLWALPLYLRVIGPSG